MKKITLLFVAVIMTVNVFSADPTWTRIWENSATLSTNPAYIGTANSSVRGMGVGTFEGEKVVVIPTREGGTFVKVLKASDGTVWKDLNVTGIATGQFVVNDAAVTNDGKILVSNVALSATAPNNLFKVYRWDNSTDAPTVAISYTIQTGLVYRLGDQITVKGSISDGSCKVYAMSTALVNTKATIFRFDMISDGNGGFVFNNTPTVITNQITATGGYASVDIMGDGKYIYKYNGSNMIKLNADGTIPSPAESSSGSIVGTGGNSVRYIMNRPAINTSDPDTAYVAYFRYGAGQERANIVKFPNGILNSSVAAVCTYLPVLGTNANGNGAGRVAIDELTSSSVNIYVLSCNNGIGKYAITWPTTPTSTFNTYQSIRITKSSSIIKVEDVENPSIELINSLGQKIKSISNKNELNIEGIKGVFIIRIKANGQIVKTEKISL